jgi:proline iminopeptidase
MQSDMKMPVSKPAAQSGMLDVGNGHVIHWETHGNPGGKPALILHGGPGSGLSATARNYFDPELWWIIQFDQRNCGKSTPHASSPAIDLSANTTHHLIGDIEAIRNLLGIERWLLLGGSWGSTLALAYAQAHPDRVSEIVLNSIARTTPAEIDWITRGVGTFFPQEWEQFADHVAEGDNSTDLVAAYYLRLLSPDPHIHQKAADAWSQWEQAIVNITPGHVPHPRWQDPTFRLCFARLVTHYWHHRAWLGDMELMDNLPLIAHIPSILIHGRLDLGGPLDGPWKLHRNWPGSQLRILDQAGHDARDPGMEDTIRQALELFSKKS